MDANPSRRSCSIRGTNFFRPSWRTFAAGTVIIASFALIFAWVTHLPSNSPAGLLRRADNLAWSNNWIQATPLYIRAEEGFRKQGDLGHALYAHVSQVPLKMESSDLSQLIADLTADLNLPEASGSSVRLRILEMKAKCEEEYDAGVARKTFAEVEQLAILQAKPFLASRASGEQGILAFTLGDIAEASSRVKRAYAVAKYLGDPAAHIRYAEMIGMGLGHLGRPKQALKFLDEAIDTQKEHPDVATPIVAYMGKIDALTQLGQFNDALTLADRVIEIPRKRNLYGELQSLLTSRSEVLSKSGRPNDAIAGYEEALGYARMLKSWRAISYTGAKLAAAFEQTNQLPKALAAIDEAISANQKNPQEMLLVPENLAIKARIRRKMGYPGEAELLYKQGASVLDVMLAHVPTAETERLLLTALSDLYSGHFELLSNEGRFAEAFEVIEGAHGRIEAQELEFDHTEVPHALTSDESQLQGLEVALIKADPKRDKGKFLQVIRSAEMSSGNAPREKTTTLTQLQSTLKPNELFIEYVLAVPHSYALAITSSSVKQHILPPKDQIEAEAGKYREILSKQKTDPKLGSEIFNHVLNFLGEYPQATSLIVVPDGGLHLLPFSAIVMGNGKYLFEVDPTSIAPSGTVLWLLRGRPSEPIGTLPYLGVAAFTMPSDQRPWVVRAASPQSTDLVPLPESRNEVESIGAMMPQPSTILLGSGATKKKFQDLPLGNYRVLHLALHGFVDPVFPDKSAIVFAPSGGDNGRLEARDIRQLHLHADLVTLSACDTGVGPVGASGVESIVAAFVQAGASSVVATLWELEDHASNKFMKAFYAHLQTVGKAEALRQAKLDLLHMGLPPYYWASYEIVGDSQGPLFPLNDIH